MELLFWKVYEFLCYIFSDIIITVKLSPFEFCIGPCHHSMVCPQIVAGGDTLKIWRVAADILNKQL
jgi:hypothetical protein